MLPKLVQAGLVDVFQPAHNRVSADALDLPAYSKLVRCSSPPKSDLHARRTPGYLPALLQTLNLSSAIRIRLALHEIVIVGLAPCADEEGGTHQGCRGGADLWDLGDVVWHGSGVDEDMLGESGEIFSIQKT